MDLKITQIFTKSWKIITTVKILLKFENMYLGIQGKNKREKKYVSFFKI